MATKSELIKMLDPYNDDHVVIVIDKNAGRWDNISRLAQQGCSIVIMFGDGPVFDN